MFTTAILKSKLQSLVFFVLLSFSLQAQFTSGINPQSSLTGCGRLTLLALPTDNSVAPIVSRRWCLTTCADSIVFCTNTSLNPNFAAIITTKGCYKLTVKMTNANGDTSVATINNINIYPKPTVNFSISPNQGCVPLIVQAQCNSVANCGVIDSVVIDAGLGYLIKTVGCPAAAVSIPFNPPLQPGCKDFSIRAYNSCGCVDTANYQDAVCIIPKPTAFFTADTTYAYCTNSPLPVNFTANATGPGMEYLWYINNTLVQGPSTNTTFQNNFAINNSSCYSIKLVVRHPTGCSDSMIRSNYICVQSTPTISFSQNITTACVNATSPANLVLTNTSSIPTSLTWNISGGTQTFGQQVGSSANYSITGTGTYTVTATGTISAGCSNNIVQQVFLASAKPNINFTVSDSFNCSLPMPVTYTPTGCPTCTYSWTFTGGAVPANSINTSPSVVYNSFGQKSATVVATLAGCTNQITKTSVNIRKVNPQIGYNKAKGCAPVCATFVDLTNYSSIYDTPASVCWSFPGSTVAPGCITPLYRCFNQIGCNDAMLIVNTTGGCVDTVVIQKAICVGKAPICGLTATPDTMCYEADTVKFTMNCDTMSYVWVDFGDGTKRSYNVNPANPTTINFDYFYQDIGTFEACLVAHRDSCPGDTLCKTIVILPPAARFSYATTCQNPNAIPLQNNSVQADSYFWEFCDGTTSTDSSPVFIFRPCDTCHIRLTTTNISSGCVHSKDSTVISNCDTASFNFGPPVRCMPKTGNLLFPVTNTSSSIGTTSWDSDTLNGLNFVIATANPTFLTYSQPGNYVIAGKNVSTTGCVSTKFQNLTVCKMEANFGPLNACLPDSIHFFDQSVDSVCGGAVKWRWTFGDGSPVDTSQNPNHFYAQGTYQVKLYVENASGCRDSITKTVVIGAPVLLNYKFDTLICSGTNSCAVNNVVATAPTYLWNSPGATNPVQSVPNPCFSYPQDGYYPVYLALTSANTCTVYDTSFIRVGDPVASGFISTDTILCPQNAPPIYFTSTSQNTDSLWIWNYGDGTKITSTTPNVIHYYPYPGNYIIDLIIVTKDGCRDTATIDTLVVLGPFGSFTFAPSPGICACQDTVHFSVSTYNASKLDLVYGCNSGFTTVNPISPIGTIQNPTIVNVDVAYCVADSCRPQVIFGDATGCDVYFEDFYVWVDTPVVALSFDNYGVCVNGVVCFQDETSYHLQSYQSFTVERLWNFGDPSSGTNDTSTLENPCHYYSQPGGYVTKLYIRSNLGCYDSLVTTVVVVPEFPVAGYFADDSLVCANSALCFHDTSYIYPLTGPDYWIWNWGDGTIDTVHSPDACHSWTSGGYYTVSMCVYDSVGCPDCDSSLVIRVVDNPTANAGGDRVVCRGVTTQLNGSGSISCLWSPMGIVSNDSICNPTINISSDTVIWLEVSDQFGCKDIDTITLSVAEVFADFTVPSNFCLEDSVCVTDISTSLNSNSTLVQWLYDFTSAGNIVSGQNSCYQYAASGTYTVKQLVTDNNGCIDSSFQTTVILPKPVAVFSLNDSVVCTYQQICATESSTSTSPITTWNWNFGTTNANYSGQNPPCHLFSAPFQPSYNVTLIIIDQNLCADTMTIPVTVNETPTATFNWSTSCESDAMPLNSSSVPGDGAINFCEWTFWLGATNPTVDNNCNTSYQFPAGSYPVQLVVGDVNGCLDTIVRNVSVDSISELSIFPGDTTICLGTSVDYSVSGVYDQIVWTPNVWLSDPNSSTVTINPLGNIAYIVSAVNGVCAAASDTFIIRTIQPVPIEVNATPQQIVLGLTSNITSQIPGQIDSIIWTPSSTLDCRDCPNPIARPIVTTTYTANIYYSLNDVTCSNSAQVTIEVLNNCKDGITYLPNTFTPNGDGLNDIFMIRGLAAVKINHFRIFDRWGKIVFETANGSPNEPKWGWDGTDLNGEQLNPAVFVYSYEIECINGDLVTGKGNVTLVR